MKQCLRPNCRGFLLPNNDEHDKFLTCALCGRSWNSDGTPKEEHTVNGYRVKNSAQLIML